MNKNKNARKTIIIKVINPEMNSRWLMLILVPWKI